MRHELSLPRIVAVMRAAARAGPDGSSGDGGFTLIELMVVLLVMGILMAIAIPNFLSASNAANDRSAQSTVTNAMVSVKSLYAQSGTYPATTKLITEMSKAEPELAFTTGVSSGVHHVSLYSAATTATPDATLAYIAVWVPETKVCWVAEDTAASNGVRYGYTSYSSPSTTTPQTKCAASLVATEITTPGSGWHTAFPLAPGGH